VHFGFHDRSGRQYGVEHQRHFLGLVGEGDQMQWIVAPALRGVPNIAADLEFPMYVDVLPDATIVVEALAASPSRKSPDGRSVAAPMTQIRPGEIIRPGQTKGVLDGARSS
jgi:hypothetical protein